MLKFYWWLFNAWVGIMVLAEWSKGDKSAIGEPNTFFWIWMGVATLVSLYYTVKEGKLLLSKK